MPTFCNGGSTILGFFLRTGRRRAVWKRPGWVMIQARQGIPTMEVIKLIAIYGEVIDCEMMMKMMVDRWRKGG